MTLTTERTDPLPGFEARLLDELLAEATAPHRPRAVRIAPPRRRGRRLALVAAAATAAASTGYALLPTGEEAARLAGDAVSRPIGAVAPEPASAAEVLRRTVSAMAERDDAIVHAVQITRTPTGDYRAEMWFDEAHPDRFRDLAFDDAGTPVLDSAYRVTAGGKRQSRQIDLAAGTWRQTSATLPAGSGGQQRSLADGIRANMAEGHLQELERRTVDGREALVLAHDEPGMNRELLVDAETFLPLRMTAHWAPGESYVITYTWLERSAETEALLWPEPPADARRLPAGPTVDEQGEKRVKQGAG